MLCVEAGDKTKKTMYLLSYMINTCQQKPRYDYIFRLLPPDLLLVDLRNGLNENYT